MIILIDYHDNLLLPIPSLYPLNMYIYFTGLFSYDIMQRCWYCEPNQRPTFEELQNELDTMLSAEHSDKYIQIITDDSYYQLFPAQNSEV